MGRVVRRQCPHCTHEVSWPETSTYPFCSERCRLIDLGMWARGDYRIPGDPVAETPPEQEGWDAEGEDAS